MSFCCNYQVNSICLWNNRDSSFSESANLFLRKCHGPPILSYPSSSKTKISSLNQRVWIGNELRLYLFPQSIRCTQQGLASYWIEAPFAKDQFPLANFQCQNFVYGIWTTMPGAIPVLLRAHGSQYGSGCRLEGSFTISIACWGRGNWLSFKFNW